MWWLKNIKWKEILKEILISILIIFSYVGLTIFGMIIAEGKIKWVTNLGIIIIIVLLVLISLFLLFAIKNYFEKKQKEFEYQKKQEEDND